MGKLSNLNKSIKKAKRVYQGSPHKHDGKLDAKKIGTGEGAQAYGYGHYVAEEKEVAKGYAEDIIDLDMLSPATDAEEVVISAFTRGAEEIEAIPSRGDITDWVSKDIDGIDASDLREAVDNLYDRAEGHLYEYDLNEAAIDNMLDWDTPLSEQSDGVKRAYAKAYFNKHYYPDESSQLSGPQRKEADDIFANIAYLDPREDRVIIKEQLAKAEEILSGVVDGDEAFTGDELSILMGNMKRRLSREIEAYPTGGEAYMLLSGGSTENVSATKAASARLKDSGIPGIKYFDEQSRNQSVSYMVSGGEQPRAFTNEAVAKAHIKQHGGNLSKTGLTRNFAIFPGSEGELKAISRNGEKLMLGGAAILGGALSSEDADAAIMDSAALQGAGGSWMQKRGDKSSKWKQFKESILEPAATVASSLASMPVQGLAGVGALAQGYGIDSAVGAMESTAEDLTYMPRSEVGMESLSNMGEAMDILGDSPPAKFYTDHINQGADWAADNIHPAAGAALKTLPELIF